MARQTSLSIPQGLSQAVAPRFLPLEAAVTVRARPALVGLVAACDPRVVGPDRDDGFHDISCGWVVCLWRASPLRYILRAGFVAHGRDPQRPVRRQIGGDLVVQIVAEDLRMLRWQSA